MCLRQGNDSREGEGCKSYKALMCCILEENRECCYEGRWKR